VTELLERIQNHPIYYEGQRVVTMSMVDTLHDRSRGTARRTFNSNRKRFVEDEDFWEFDGTANVLRTQLIAAGFLDGRTPSFILLSESGYLKTTKPMRDDESWNVMTKLIKCYFRIKQQSEPSIQNQIKEAIEAHMESQKAQNNYNNKMFNLLLSFGASAMATARHHRPKNPHQQPLPFPDKSQLEGS